MKSKHWVKAMRKTLAIVFTASFLFSNTIVFGIGGAGPIRNIKSDAVVAKYTTDLTQLGREGRLRQDLSLESEAIRLTNALAEGGLRQPVLVTDLRETRNTIVEQLAIRIANGDVPEGLAGRDLVRLDVDNVYSNAANGNDFEALVLSILDDAVSDHGKKILFIDDLGFVLQHKNAAERILSCVAEGKIAVIGGSSVPDYRDRIEADGRFSKAFTAFEIKDLRPASSDDAASAPAETYRGGTLSPDLREMIASDPSGKTRVNVIVQARNADNPALRQLIASGEARITDRIGSTDTLVVNMPLSTVQTLSQSGLANYISPDRPTTTTGHIEDTTGLSLMRSQPALNGRSAYTLDGTGIGIAVLDSGIYAAHNGFKNNSGASRIVANVNFTNANITDTSDGFGHGTHVAGLAAGNSSVSSGAYRGVASNANIISVKVLDNNGQGQQSWLLNGLNWVLTNRTTYNIRVVNLSLGATAIDTYTNDPVCLKVKELAAAGIVVIAAAGNLGKDSLGNKRYGQIHSPGNSPYVITVGASNTMGTTAHGDDTIASTSPVLTFITTTAARASGPW